MNKTTANISLWIFMAAAYVFLLSKGHDYWEAAFILTMGGFCFFPIAASALVGVVVGKLFKSYD